MFGDHRDETPWNPPEDLITTTPSPRPGTPSPACDHPRYPAGSLGLDANVPRPGRWTAHLAAVARDSAWSSDVVGQEIRDVEHLQDAMIRWPADEDNRPGGRPYSLDLDGRQTIHSQSAKSTQNAKHWLGFFVAIANRWSSAGVGRFV